MIDDPTMFARNSVRRHIIRKYIFEFDNHGKIYLTKAHNIYVIFDTSEQLSYININEFYWRN